MPSLLALSCSHRPRFRVLTTLALVFWWRRGPSALDLDSHLNCHSLATPRSSLARAHTLLLRVAFPRLLSYRVLCDTALLYPNKRLNLSALTCRSLRCIGLWLLGARQRSSADPGAGTHAVLQVVAHATMMVHRAGRERL